MAGPTVVLTFGGDSKPATTALDDVGKAAEDMDSRVSDSSSGLDSAGQAFDDTEGKAQGFNDTLSGATDTMAGVGQMASGDMLGGLMTLGGGIADLAGGISSFLIPVFGQVIAATWAWTAALFANPVTWIVIGILALIAVIILLVVYWDEVTAAIGAGWDWMKKKFGEGKDWIIEKGVGLLNWFRELPGKLKSAASGMWDGIKDSFKSAVNWLIDRWNSFELTIGGGSVLGVDIPQVTLSTPNIPRMHTGGTVPGPPGADVMTLLQAGEEVTAAGAARDARRGGGTITFAGPEAILAMLRQLIKNNGGVDVVFGNA